MKVFARLDNLAYSFVNLTLALETRDKVALASTPHHLSLAAGFEHTQILSQAGLFPCSIVP